MAACKYGDPFCPCQDGDSCHYEGVNPMKANWLGKMTWAEAVEAMRAGKAVQRASEQTRKLIGHSDGVPIYECGEEACMLMHAWTDDERPVLVFRGVGSKQLFVPESEHREATDWVLAG